MGVPVITYANEPNDIHATPAMTTMSKAAILVNIKMFCSFVVNLTS